MIILYVGGPIDRADEVEATTWRSLMRTEAGLREEPIMMYDPFASFLVTGEQDLSRDEMALISRTNRSFLAQADAAIFYLGGRSPAFGTIREIEYASARRVPTVVVGDDVGRHVEAHDLVVRPDIKSGLDALLDMVEQDGGSRHATKFDPTELQEVKPIIPEQQHAQQPASNDFERIIGTMAAILAKPEHMHQFPDGKMRKLMVVDTMTYNRVMHRLEEEMAVVVTGKFDDGYLYIELLEK